MFNRKLVSVLCYIVAVLLVAKVLLMLVMFVWGFFGTPPVQMFDMRLEPTVRYILFIQEMGTTIFIFIVLCAAKYLTCCCGCGSCDTKGAKKKIGKMS
jgi:hypothetical protein